MAHLSGRSRYLAINSDPAAGFTELPEYIEIARLSRQSLDVLYLILSRFQ